MSDKVDTRWFYVVCAALAVCAYLLVSSMSNMRSLESEIELGVQEREAAIAGMAEESNSKYNRLLESASYAKQRVYEQCDWLEANISDGVAAYCYDAADEFNETDAERDPINIDDFNTFEHLEYYAED